MIARVSLSLLAALVAIQPAQAAPKRVITPSGEAELLLLGRTLIEARYQLADICEKLGWAPRKNSSDRRLLCDVPGKDKRSVIINERWGDQPGNSASADPNNYMYVPVRRTVTFNFERSGNGVIVRAHAERFLPAVRMGRFNREPIENKDTFDGLLNIIALAGDTAFVPGTRFGDQGYLGFRSDRFAEIEVDGIKRTAIQVGAIEAASPAEAAGLEPGDFVLAMNGRTFENYDEIQRFLGALEPGEHVAMLVERGGQRVELAATASSAPATLAAVTN